MSVPDLRQQDVTNEHGGPGASTPILYFGGPGSYLGTETDNIVRIVMVLLSPSRHMSEITPWAVSFACFSLLLSPTEWWHLFFVWEMSSLNLHRFWLSPLAFLWFSLLPPVECRDDTLKYASTELSPNPKVHQTLPHDSLRNPSCDRSMASFRANSSESAI